MSGLRNTSMKAKTANKGHKEPTISRKPRKPDRKYIYGKEKTEEKKQRRSIQKNRFTSMEEIQNPAGKMSLELFGSLIFNLAEETSDFQISDSTGDYELRVSNDTLKEFKLKVLLGIDHRSKPKFTILLGDCQCYPELPEGTLDSRRRLVEDEHLCKLPDEKVNVEEDEGHRPIEIGRVDEVKKTGYNLETSLENDMANSVKPRSGVTAVERETIPRSQMPEQGDADDELTQLSRKSTRTKKVEKVGKHRSMEHKKNAKLDRQRQYKINEGASTYMNNLEGFIQFLMNDEICYSALANTGAPPNVTKVARRIVGGRNLIKYSDGKEFLITFEEKDTNTAGKDQNESSSCPPNSVKSDSDDNLSSLRELLSASHDRTGKRLEEEASAREELMRANEFVETVKNEVVEWQARCEEAIDVTIVCNEEAATLTEKPIDNVKLDISDVLKGLHKVEDVYDDATSDSSNVAQADSLEQFFQKLDEYENMAASKETNITVTRVDKGLAPGNFNKEKPDDTNGKSEISHFQHRYVPPIPLNMTSAKDIELMWMAFVEQFCSNDDRLNGIMNLEPTNSTTSQRTHKSDLHFGQYQQICSSIDCARNIMNNPNKKNLVDKVYPIQNSSDNGCSSNMKKSNMQKISNDNVSYPGQNCLPYFVEANLKRVNSVMGSIKVSSSHTSNVDKSEHDFMLFRYPHQAHAGGPEPKYNFPAGVRMLIPGTCNPISDRRGSYPLQRNANTLPQDRFPNQRNRIFFNPNVSAGDWY